MGRRFIGYLVVGHRENFERLPPGLTCYSLVYSAEYYFIVILAKHFSIFIFCKISICTYAALIIPRNTVTIFIIIDLVR